MPNARQVTSRLLADLFSELHSGTAQYQLAMRPKVQVKSSPLFQGARYA